MPAEHLTLIDHVHLIDCQKRKSEVCDILFRRKVGNRLSEILEIGKNLKPSDSAGSVTSIKGAGLYACPSFVDLHMHTCEPGAMFKEDIRTATLAAVKGGYGRLLALPDEAAIELDAHDMLDYVYSNATAKGSCDIRAAAYLTVGNKGEQLCDFDDLLAHKAVAFFDDGHTPAPLLYQAMKACAERNALIILQPCDRVIAADGAVNEAIARSLRCPPIPQAAESAALATALALAEVTGCRLHITLVSSAHAVALIRDAKARGVKVTCDTAPQYFALTHSDLHFYGSLVKVDPPLRSSADREAIINALADRTIDCIVSDHTPKSPEEKSLPLAKAAFGMVGLQTVFALGMRELVLTKRLDIYRLIELLSIAPAAILGLPCTLQSGSRADFNLLDLDSEYLLSADLLNSKSKNCPWIGQSFVGSVSNNFYNGQGAQSSEKVLSHISRMTSRKR